jgi:dTDP-4-amino-4,6-dideoxygalactose transaminase
MAGPGAYWIGDEEKREVLEVLESGYLFRYGQVDDPKFLQKTLKFEQKFAEFCGVKHALATSSGTGSLLVSLLALGLKPGDEVIVPAYTFVASYTSTIFAGLVPVLAEIDDSLTLDPTDLERRITPRTKAIMPVHMLGNSCKMDAITEIARKHNLLVLEDACQAGGGSYRGRRLGSIGNMGAFSLNVFKTISSGDGGVVVTDDAELYEKAFGFHDQGHKPFRSGVEVGRRDILGLNFRFNELLSGVALAQLAKLDNILATLRTKKNKLKSLIGDIPGICFRTLNDPEGECATLCTIIFDDPQHAARVARTLGTMTIANSGWHVYANMEHVNRHLESVGQPHGKGAYPQTDEILARAMNISIGVVDGGLGAGFGLCINSDEDEIVRTAKKFRNACLES